MQVRRCVVSLVWSMLAAVLPAYGDLLYSFSYTAQSGAVQSFSFSLVSPTFVAPGMPAFQPFAITDGATVTISQALVGISPGIILGSTFLPPGDGCFSFGSSGADLFPCSMGFTPNVIPQAGFVVDIPGGLPSQTGTFSNLIFDGAILLFPSFAQDIFFNCCGSSSGTMQLTVSQLPAGPVCQVSEVVAGPPKQLIVAMQDFVSGLKSINLVDSLNASVSIPAFSPATTSQVLVTATKVEQNQSSDVAFQVTNMAGNTTTCDPVDFTLSLDGATERHVFRSVNPAEHYIRITNGTPGVRQMTFFVNTHSFPIPALKDGETYSLDIGSAMEMTPDSTEAPRIGVRPVPRRGPGQAANNVVMYASGPRGSSAYILIGDSSVLSGSPGQTPQ